MHHVWLPCGTGGYTYDHIWQVGVFWESLHNQPALRSDVNFTLSYRRGATFPNFHMISDTLKWSERHKAVSYASKRRNPLMSAAGPHAPCTSTPCTFARSALL